MSRVLDHRRIIFGDDAVFLNGDPGVVTLRGAEVTALARSLVLSIHQESTVDAAIARFEANHPHHADALMSILARSGIVQEHDAAAPAASAFARFVHLRKGPEAVARLERGKLVVAGTTAAAGSLVEQVVAAGCAGAALVEGPGALDSIGSPDLVVAVTERDDLYAQRAVALWGNHRGVASLYVAVGTFDLRVGPLVRPGLTACWNCCRLRLLANEGTLRGATSAYELQCRMLAEPWDADRDSMCTLFDGLASRVGALHALEFLAGGKRSALEGAVWIFDYATANAATHRVIPLPWCSVCGGASAISDAAPFGLDGERIRIDTAPMTLPGWIDAYTGIITATWTDDSSAGVGEPVAVRAVVADYADEREPPSGVTFCSGKGLSRHDAFRGAVGECFERYSAARVPRDSLRRASVDELSGSVLLPECIGLYSIEQYATSGFPFERFDSRSRHAWVEGRWLDDRTPVWLPAQAVFFGAVDPDARYCQVTSNGLAAGEDFEGAALRAVLELIERDALTVTWLCRRPARRLDVTALDSESSAVMAFLKARHAEVELVLLDVGIAVPTVMALGRGDGIAWPGLCVGAAADRTVRKAARNAILELAATGMALSRTLPNAEPITLPVAIRTDAFGDHARYYLDPARSGAADFLGRSAANAVALAESSNEAFSDLGDLAHVLARSGVRVALADVTSADIRLAGIIVIRAVADGLQPLHCGYGTERRAASRLRRALRGDVNPDPHPFC